MPVFLRVTTGDERIVVNANYVVEIREEGAGATIAVDKGSELATYPVQESVEDLCSQLSTDPRNRRLTTKPRGTGLTRA